MHFLYPPRHRWLSMEQARTTRRSAADGNDQRQGTAHDRSRPDIFKKGFRHTAYYMAPNNNRRHPRARPEPKTIQHPAQDRQATRLVLAADHSRLRKAALYPP